MKIDGYHVEMLSRIIDEQKEQKQIDEMEPGEQRAIAQSELTRRINGNSSKVIESKMMLIVPIRPDMILTLDLESQNVILDNGKAVDLYGVSFTYLRNENKRIRIILTAKNRDKLIEAISRSHLMDGVN